MQPNYSSTESPVRGRSGRELFPDNVSSTHNVLRTNTLGRYMEALEKLCDSARKPALCDNIMWTGVRNLGENEEEEEYDLDVLETYQEESFSLTTLRPYQQEAVTRCREELEIMGYHLPNGLQMWEDSCCV
ncbi:hypothetical protein TcBrA4_0047840 [Trypanosoma cruzi]|nr:hypothetical protein TcBrA4_0047840 [Trypanosoma cruzi]